MIHKKMSIIAIAEMAGVSIATVSRVLNKSGRYSAETEKKVMQIVDQYGYQPNVSAKSLRTNKTQSIGVIVPDITNEFFAKIVRSIENYISPHGYSVFICDSHENQKIETRHIQNLVAKNVDGLIYISGKEDLAGNELIYDIPVVYIDRHPANAPTIVESDNLRGGYLAAEELIKKGCKKIALILDYYWLSTQKARYQGFLDAHAQYGVIADEQLMFSSIPGYEDAKALVCGLIEKQVEFDGVFASNDMLALGALHALADAGVEIPGQVKIVGFDDISVSEFCQVPLTTITQNTDEIGRLSVNGLMRQMDGERDFEPHIIVDVALHVRKTT